MPVVDASVLVELLADGEHAELVGERLAAEEHALWAPYLVDAEVGHALRRVVRLGGLDADVAGEALWQLDELPVRRVAHELLIHVAWVLRDNLSFYDALYVALAEMLEEPLLTFDARLARAGLETKVEVLAQA
ncbi:MAG TPA: type II toxin-antitoxin system VapC family toxin [Solirubrobacterales bacterium]|jgi:predicted nucleic acid-binding protein|nr:type II toxin-antitoxin system VapC family toxin [Solirubrobacterales bacterium]